MPRYYFHLYNRIGSSDDGEGRDLASLDVAQAAAIKDIRSILGEEVRQGSVDLTGRIEIVDAAGARLLTVPFADAVELRLPG